MVVTEPRLTIGAHSVPILPSGLSPMQDRLLRSEKFVRLVSAPTGSGKSYALLWAVLREKAHVLFVVPTRRLLQNLKNDARASARSMLQERGWNDAQIENWTERHILEWSGNQPPEPTGSLTATRARQALDPGSPSGGRIIFAIPEVVIRMLSGIPLAGAGEINPFFWLKRFDHVVLDEFHTIDDSSFGLASLLSLLAVNEKKCRLSLMSATPVDVTGILAKLGVETNEIETIAEQVVPGHPPGHRPIHGDVEISLSDRGVADLIEGNLGDVTAGIREGYTAIAIFDSLERLKKDIPRIRAALMRAGVASDRILEINSQADATIRPGEPARGRVYADPHNYDVLLCTSSVEVGVSFRSTLMFMDAGYGPASFVQRVGRVARGRAHGRVVVSLPPDVRGRRAWTRPVAKLVEEHDHVGVETFVEHVLRRTTRRLEPTRRETATPMSAESGVQFYSRPSWRGAFWAALFVVAVRRTRMKVQNEARRRLFDISPANVRFVDARIGEIIEISVVNRNLPRNRQPHKRWVMALLAAAFQYRDIGSTITVVDPDGSARPVRESYLRRTTDLLNRYIAHYEDGEPVIRLTAKSLDDEVRSYGKGPPAPKLSLHVRSPIGGAGYTISLSDRERRSERLHVLLVEEWQRHFGPRIPERDATCNDPPARVMAAATALVEKLGLPPLDEHYEDDSVGESALFA